VIFTLLKLEWNRKTAYANSSCSQNLYVKLPPHATQLIQTPQQTTAHTTLQRDPSHWIKCGQPLNLEFALGAGVLMMPFATTKVVPLPLLLAMFWSRIQRRQKKFGWHTRHTTMRLETTTIEVEELAEGGVDTATIPTMLDGLRRYTLQLTTLPLWTYIVTSATSVVSGVGEPVQGATIGLVASAVLPLLKPWWV
jgi:hypothetical protein